MLAGELEGESEPEKESVGEIDCESEMVGVIESAEREIVDETDGVDVYEGDVDCDFVRSALGVTLGEKDVQVMALMTTVAPKGVTHVGAE